MFLAHPSDGRQNSYTWIENTPQVWSELRDVLEANKPATILLNIDSNIAFSSGLHAGEWLEITEQLGLPWKDRFRVEPMVGVEYVGTMPKSQLSWYRRLMETACATISEGFSGDVITPGETTVEV